MAVLAACPPGSPGDGDTGHGAAPPKPGGGGLTARLGRLSASVAACADMRVGVAGCARVGPPRA
eukprot:7358806-Lingulodinium_polyedra.AAC.1